MYNIHKIYNLVGFERKNEQYRIYLTDVGINCGKEIKQRFKSVTSIEYSKGNEIPNQSVEKNANYI